MDSVFFLDSWGAIWETCSPDDNDACAFGPRGCARKVAREAYEGFIVCEEEGGFETVLLF